MSVLIVTMPNDVHSHAVKWAIDRLGGECEILYPADLSGGATWSLRSEKAAVSITMRGAQTTLDFDKYKTIWMRRPPGVFPQDQIADRVERSVAESEFKNLASSVYHSLEEKAFVVNPLNASSIAACKPYQLSVAKRVGLEIPNTIVTNSGEDAQAFFRECGGHVIYKPLQSPTWFAERADGRFASIIPTTVVSQEMLFAADVEWAPCIFQEKINKVAEIRATFIGENLFAWRKTFSQPARRDVDWRFVHRDAILEQCAVPDDVRQGCLSLMRMLGLLFGCIDIVVDEIGRHIFLEINPQGQWLYGDSEEIGLCQLGAMAEFLLAGDPSHIVGPKSRFSVRDVPVGWFEKFSSAEIEAHFGDWQTHTFHHELYPTNPILPLLPSEVAAITANERLREQLGS